MFASNKMAQNVARMSMPSIKIPGQKQQSSRTRHISVVLYTLQQGRCCLDELRHRMLVWIAPSHKRRLPLDLCAILPFSHYTRMLESQKNTTKKRRLPSVAPSLTCGAQGSRFEPQRRRRLVSVYICH